MYIAVPFHREIYVKWSDSSFTVDIARPPAFPLGRIQDCSQEGVHL